MKSRCNCKKSIRRLTFEKVKFSGGGAAYRGRCTVCGKVWRYKSIKNYKLIGTRTNPKGGDT